MDHDKPEVVPTQGIEPLGGSTDSPRALDLEYASTASPDELGEVEDRKDPRGVSLWYA
jgi:hypothetical protein